MVPSCPPPQAEDGECGCAAGDVDQAVPDRARARGEEGLVILVEQRDERDERKRGDVPIASHACARRREKRAGGEQREHGVLHEVRKFAHGEMDKEQLRLRDIREEPFEQRPDDPRRVRR